MLPAKKSEGLAALEMRLRGGNGEESRGYIEMEAGQEIRALMVRNRRDKITGSKFGEEQGDVT